jgi:transcriptional regulator with XRE-family HTH domain
MDRILLGQRLRQCREQLGWSQQQVADQLGITRSSYAYYETGASCPRLPTLCKLAKLYHVSYDELLDGMDE